MSGVDFLDTNVLVYALDDDAPGKQPIAARIVVEAVQFNAAMISYQVVQEALHVVTGKFKNRVKPEDALRMLDTVWTPLMKILPSAALYRDALRIKDRYGFSFYDALVVASALQGNCKRLLSEDLQHGQVIEGLKVVNPFLGS